MRPPPARDVAIAERAAARSRLNAVQLLEDKHVVWDHLWPLVSGGRRNSNRTFELTIRRCRDGGRAVAEYTFGAGTRVFAKLYPDVAAARAVYRIHDELWRNGFGAGSRYSVPEPLGFIEEHAIVVLSAVAGNCLGASESDRREAFEDGVRRAARWLAALHSSPVAVGPRETVSDSMSRLRRRAGKAASSCPQLADIIRTSLAELATRYPAAHESKAPVQTHGRFHAAHVFLCPQSVTAIDLDRAAVAGAAKDVGEFLCVLRAIAHATARKRDAADDACEMFLDEYVGRRPASLPELSFYWSYSVAWTLLRLAFKDRPARRGWARRVEFLRAEFDDVPRRVAAWLES